MSQIINISQAYPAAPALRSVIDRPAQERATSSRSHGSDTMEFSRAALARAVELSSLRIATTAAIRSEIEEGTYETDERIDGTVTRLLDVVG